MGRPFESELRSLDDTLTWAFDQDVENLREKILSQSDRPFYIIGSGGSFSACHYAAELLQFYGYMAKAITPLALHQNRVKIFKSNLIFISASGKNTDILSSFESALSQDPSAALSITLKFDSPLKKLSANYTVAKNYEYDLPAGKDGFLATNSLVAFFALLNKAIAKGVRKERLGLIDEDQALKIRNFSKKNSNKKSFVVIYGGWSSSPAVDLESKFSEAALGSILLSDYRNFGHGRHHWFDKQSKDSVIILLSTPAEEKLADKTISILPKSIPHLKLFVNDVTSSASIALLIQVFHFVNEIGKGKKIDPGRPGVPAYGSRLYNLRYKTLVKSKAEVSTKHHLALSRKIESPELLSSEDLKIWNAGLENFIRVLSSTKFGGFIFDYDGTLCSSDNRFTGMSCEITQALIKILEKGLVLGIATGRGKSVREDFQKQVPERYWDQIVIAYYNGADIGMLRNGDAPDIKSQPHPTLQYIAEQVASHPVIGKKIKTELRPFQLTININNIAEWRYARPILANLLMTLNLLDIQMLESSHSCDIVIKSKASKLNVLSHCNEMASSLKCAPEFLCIGDRGQWPGNDFELLSYKFSLSVDEVSPDINSCWNFAEAGKRNTEATLYYLSKIQYSKNDRSFSLKI